MKKEITATLYVSINGVDCRWEDLSTEQQKEISIALNDRAMQAIGYRRIQKEPK
jgi:hypothetical protein